jgi:DNA mismatch repair protein MSH3
MAIAGAVLEQLVEHTRSKTLFITHYPLTASEIERKYPKDVENIHMGYHVSDTRIDGTRDITFLYKVEPGITTGMIFPELLTEWFSNFEWIIANRVFWY